MTWIWQGLSPTVQNLPLVATLVSYIATLLTNIAKISPVIKTISDLAVMVSRVLRQIVWQGWEDAYLMKFIIHIGVVADFGKLVHLCFGFVITSRLDHWKWLRQHCSCWSLHAQLCTSCRCVSAIITRPTISTGWWWWRWWWQSLRHDTVSYLMVVCGFLKEVSTSRPALIDSRHISNCRSLIRCQSACDWRADCTI